MNDELKSYIESELKDGESKETIRKNLLSNGWPEEVVAAALEQMNQDSVVAPTPFPASEQNIEIEESDLVIKTKSNKGLIGGVIVGAIVLFMLIGVGLAYFLELGPFSEKLPYSEENLVSGIVTSVAKMKTFTYSVKGKLEVEERDEGAMPFAVVITEEMQKHQEAYSRDYDRQGSVKAILSQLKYKSEMPDLLTDVNISNDSIGFGYESDQNLSIFDPLTKDEYKYYSTGDDFQLTVVFETDEAISEFDMYPSSGTTVDVSTKTVVFTINSSTYFYFPSSLPKSYFEELSEMMAYLPPEMEFEVDLSATTDFTKEDSDWSVSADMTGDFGDLTYKVAGDVIRKDKDFYFRVRNLPSIVMGFFSYEKNVWVRVASDWIEENNGYGGISAPTFLIPGEDEEEEYKADREDIGKFLKEMLKIADEEKVLLVKNNPEKVEKEGVELYRYNLTSNKEKIAPFFEKMIAESEKYEATTEFDLASDMATLEYLKSAEFDAVFDYYNENISITMWVSKAGFIDSVEYSLRIVPDDSATQLEGKQARFTIELGFSDINEPVNISVPDEFIEIDGGDSQIDPTFGLNDARTTGVNASIKQTITNIRSQAELVYNSDNYTYDSVCESPMVQSLLDAAQDVYSGGIDGVTYDTEPTEDNVACLDGDTWFVVQAPVFESDRVEFPYWCVDSTGFSGGRLDALLDTDESCS